MSMEWKVVPVQSTNDIREAMRDKNTMQAKWAAGIAAAPTEGAPAIVDAEKLERLQTADLELQQERGYYLRQREELAALRRDAERLRNLLDVAYDHLRAAGYETDGPTLKQLEAGCNAALAANGEKA